MGIKCVITIHIIICVISCGIFTPAIYFFVKYHQINNNINECLLDKNILMVSNIDTHYYNTTSYNITYSTNRAIITVDLCNMTLEINYELPICLYATAHIINNMLHCEGIINGIMIDNIVFPSLMHDGTINFYKSAFEYVMYGLILLFTASSFYMVMLIYVIRNIYKQINQFHKEKINNSFSISPNISSSL